jgi:Flp pilus assembly protein TadD
MAARESKSESYQVCEKSGDEDPPAAAISAGASRMERFLDLFRTGNALAISLSLFVLVVWVFLPSLRGDFIEFDDSVYVTGNAHVQSGLTWENLAWGICHTVVGNWHPLTVWSLMVDRQIYGLKPWGYHLTNVLLHAVNTVLVFLVLRQITGATWRSLMVAGLFGVHPLRVESVAWICERKDVLSLVFWMLAISAYAKYVVASKSHSPECKAWYGLTLVMFACGLMSKSMVVTLPFVLLLLDYWPFQRFQFSTPDPRPAVFLKSVGEKAPFFILTAFTCAVAYISGRTNGAMNFLPGLTIGARFGNALVSYGRYLGKLVWPVNLCAHYFHPGYWPLGKVLFAGLLLSGLSVLVFAMRRQRPYLLVGWLWYLGTLVPVIGLVQAGSQSMADRFTYIPCLGLLFALVWETHGLTTRWRHQGISLCTAGSMITLGCIALTRHQTSYWKDGVAVWGHAVAMEKNDYDAHDRLGRALAEQADIVVNASNRLAAINGAIREFQEAIRLKPDYAEAQSLLGNALLSTGRLDEAILHYLKALEVEPALLDARNNVGSALLQKGQIEAALAQFQKALELQPNLPEAHNNLGLALFQRRQVDEAIAEYQKAISLKPDYAKAHNSLGSALLQKGQMEAALAHFQKALELQPNLSAAHNNLGLVLLQRRQTNEAIMHFQKALELQPDLPEAHNNLGLALLLKGQLDSSPGFVEAHHDLGCALMQKGRLDEAIAHLRSASELQPSLAEEHHDLGYALLQKGQLDEAITEFRKALSLKPDYASASNNLAAALARKNATTEFPAAKAKP